MDKKEEKTEKDRADAALCNGKSHSKRRRRALILCLLLALFTAACAFVLSDYRHLRSELLSRVLPPAAYMALLEREHLNTLADGWQNASERSSAQLSEYSVCGVSLRAEANRLVSGILGAGLPLRSAELAFRYAAEDAAGLLQTTLSVNDTACATLELMTEPARERLLAACPELSGAAIALPISSDVLLIRLLEHVCDLAVAFFTSISETVRANPFRYLPPFLDALENVRLEREQSIIISGQTVLAMRLHAVVSLDRALQIASKQLTAAEQSQQLSDSLISCYRSAVWLLNELSERLPLQLHIIAYADRDGYILGHEFELTSSGVLLFSLTGLLSKDGMSTRSGTVTAAWGAATLPQKSDFEKELAFEIDRLGLDPATSYPTGKITVGIPGSSPPLGLQFVLTERDGLPDMRIFLRVSGITAVSAELSLTETPPSGNSLTGGYSTVYPLSEWRNFLTQLDFGAFLAGLQERLGFDPSSLLPLLERVRGLFSR
ncbi:MAG: hypothetical protein K2N94_10545 [Lachnospiraceae bacterium]|nr:hypothetical protein [Lachnospiraceae bacterium]